MDTRTSPELHPDERTRRLREAILADPARPVRLGILAPGGYGKTAVLAELAAAYRSTGTSVAFGVDEADASSVLLVDDAHRLPATTLTRIAELPRVIAAARPWPAPPELAALGGMTRLRAFDRAQVATVLAGAGVPGRAGLEEFVLAQTGGVPAFVDRLARALAGSGPEEPLGVPAAALAEFGAELEALPGAVLAFLLAADAGVGLHADLLGDLLGCTTEAVAEVAKAARASGLVDWLNPGGALIPIVRLAIRALVPVDRHTAVRSRLAAAQLARGPAWAETVALSGDLDTALRAADQVLAAPDSTQHAEAARVAAAALAHRGQLASSAELFAWSRSPLAPGFASIGLVGTGQPAPNAGAAPGGPPTLLSGAVTLMADGVAASVSGSPTDALSGLVRASSLLEPAEATVLLPDSPAALAAIVAVHSGELTVAESVLDRAVTAGMGGVPFAMRHRLLRAWVDMAAGDLAAARERLRGAGPARVARDWLFAVAIEVGLARRSSDVSALHRVWAQAGEAVIRHPVDLFTLLPLGEFAVAAARLGDSDRLAAHLRDARALLAAHGDPALWATSLNWSCLHAAIIADERAAAASYAEALTAAEGCGRYNAVLAAAARAWLDVLRGSVDPASVEAAARDLHGVGLRWDAARLAGQAAIRTADRKAMAGLMECARLLQGGGELADTVADPEARLSEREQQVARLVLSGLTYREVGDRLFISAKTVEHHVARMRQRLGSTSRRELLDQLRELLGE